MLSYTVSFLLSALIAVGVGALVALPVLRLTGLYLALSTLAFGVLMDKVVIMGALTSWAQAEVTLPLAAVVVGLELL